MRPSLRAGLAGLLPRLRRALRAPRDEEAPPLRGKLRCSVVVREPGEPFSEAVFILRESALRSPGVSRVEILEQAREAAGLYTRSALPGGGGLRPLAAFLLGAAAGLLLMVLLGLL